MTLELDEGVRGVLDEEKMRALKTGFPARPETAWSRPATRARSPTARRRCWWAIASVAAADGFKPRARFRARVVVGSDPMLQLTGVIPATQARVEEGRALVEGHRLVRDQRGLRERRAVAGRGSSGVDLDKVNPWGGAIAHGHPLGATGGGLMAKMITGLEKTGGQFGLQTMCIGHGQATCTVIERV